MTYSVSELCQSFASILKEGNHKDAHFQQIDDVTSFSSHSLIFISDASQLPAMNGSLPAVIITTASIAQQIEEDSVCIITADNVRLAQAKIKQHYADYDASDAEWDAIHPSAVIHSTARLAEDVRVGPNSVIGENVKIGVGTIVRANCVIERDAQIGSSCIINNLVNLGQGCKVGDRVILRPGVIIGNEGFGFGQDEQRHYHRVPHTGIVVLEDDVQIGANCNIDRATYGETIIRRGVKIDALCHVAHNCIVEEDALFVAQTGIAGSCKIGKRVICSGQTGMIDHRTVADDAVLVHRCGVTEDIPTAGMWAGTPPKPFKQYVSNLSATSKLQKRIAKLEAELDALKG